VTQKITVVTGEASYRIWPDCLNGYWPKAVSIRLVPCGPHGPPQATMIRRIASSGSDGGDQSPVVILWFAEYALLFPIYIFAWLSLSVLFRQSLLDDSQLNISICR